jgi:RNA polymerase sigma-70 factor, ECF subfamily
MPTAAVERRSLRAVEAEQSDHLLLARIQAGDEVALRSAYDQHAAMVFGLARRVLRNEHSAQDIAQEVFAYLWEFPDRVDLARGSLRSYLAVVAHRRAVDEVRRAERRHRAAAGQENVEVTDGPEDYVAGADAFRWARQRLVAALDQLPTEQRDAIRLAYFSGQTYTEVARTLGIAEGTAKSRMRLALARMRRQLGDELRTALP